MALNAETRIRKATETVMNMFHNAYDQYINHLVKERDAALHQMSEAKAETERVKEEALKLKQENECIKGEMQRWKREAEESRRQLASTGVRMSLTIVPLGDPGTSGSPPKPDSPFLSMSPVFIFIMVGDKTANRLFFSPVLHNDGPVSYCSLDQIFSGIFTFSLILCAYLLTVCCR